MDGHWGNASQPQAVTPLTPPVSISGLSGTHWLPRAITSNASSTLKGERLRNIEQCLPLQAFEVLVCCHVDECSYDLPTSASTSVSIEGEKKSNRSGIYHGATKTQMRFADQYALTIDRRFTPKGELLRNVRQHLVNQKCVLLVCFHFERAQGLPTSANTSVVIAAGGGGQGNNGRLSPCPPLADPEPLSLAHEGH